MFNHKNLTEKVAMWFLLVTIAATCLAGCGRRETRITFVFMRTSDETRPYWQEVISDFEAENPDIQVDLEVFTWDEGRDKIAEMVEQGHPPTLARVATRWLPEYVAAGLLEPVDDYLTPDFRAEFFPLLINEGAQYQGRTLGLPVTVSVRALYYNKDLFEQVGVSAPPETWDELRETAVKIGQLSDEVHGFGLQGNLIGTERYFYYFLWGNDGDVLAPDGIRAAFNSPQGVEALTYLRDLVEAGATQPDPSQDDRQSLETGFVEGRFGMVITGPWLAKRLEEEAPDLNYGVASIPFNTNPATQAVEDTLILFKQAENKEAAWKFVEFIYQDKYRLEYALREGVLPEKIAVAKDPALVASNPTIAFFMELLPSGRFEPLNIKSAEIAEIVIEAVQEVYRGEKDPQTALDAAAAQTNELLSYSATAW